MKAIDKEKNEILSKLLKKNNTTDDPEKNKMVDDAIRKSKALDDQVEKLGKQSNVFVGSDGIQFGFETIVADVRKLDEFLEISLSELRK